jgi:hypothetical protein
VHDWGRDERDSAAGDREANPEGLIAVIARDCNVIAAIQKAQIRIYYGGTETRSSLLIFNFGN